MDQKQKKSMLQIGILGGTLHLGFYVDLLQPAAAKGQVGQVRILQRW